MTWRPPWIFEEGLGACLVSWWIPGTCIYIEHFKNGTLLMVFANTVLCICGSKMRNEVAMLLNKWVGILTLLNAGFSDPWRYVDAYPQGFCIQTCPKVSLSDLSEWSPFKQLSCRPTWEILPRISNHIIEKDENAMTNGFNIIQTNQERANFMASP